MIIGSGVIQNLERTNEAIDTIHCSRHIDTVVIEEAREYDEDCFDNLMKVLCIDSPLEHFCCKLQLDLSGCECWFYHFAETMPNLRTLQISITSDPKVCSELAYLIREAPSLTSLQVLVENGLELDGPQMPFGWMQLGKALAENDTLLHFSVVSGQAYLPQFNFGKVVSPSSLAGRPMFNSVGAMVSFFELIQANCCLRYLHTGGTAEACDDTVQKVLLKLVDNCALEEVTIWGLQRRPQAAMASTSAVTEHLLLWRILSCHPMLITTKIGSSTSHFDERTMVTCGMATKNAHQFLKRSRAAVQVAHHFAVVRHFTSNYDCLTEPLELPLLLENEAASLAAAMQSLLQPLGLPPMCTYIGGAWEGEPGIIVPQYDLALTVKNTSAHKALVQSRLDGLSRALVDSDIWLLCGMANWITDLGQIYIRVGELRCEADLFRRAIGTCRALARTGVVDLLVHAGRTRRCTGTKLPKRVPGLLGSRAALRKHDLLAFRRAHEAHRDAGRVFKAASEGRPMELAKRLRLGKLAGGVRRTSSFRGLGPMAPIEAAAVFGHWECVKVLEEQAGEARPSDTMVDLVNKLAAGGCRCARGGSD